METLSNSDWPKLSPVKRSKADKVPSEKNKKCDVCSFETSKNSHLKRHMKIHMKVKSEHMGPLSCPDCDKAFEIKKYLTAHMKTHIAKDKLNEKDTEKKKCITCNYETHRNFDLKKHMKTHEKLQSIDKNFVCDICNFVTTKGSHLKKHMSTHKPNTCPPFEVTKCPDCEKSFHTKKALTAHKHTHTKVNQVNCDLCNKSFSKKANLSAYRLCL